MDAERLKVPRRARTRARRILGEEDGGGTRRLGPARSTGS